MCTEVNSAKLRSGLAKVFGQAALFGVRLKKKKKKRRGDCVWGVIAATISPASPTPGSRHVTCATHRTLKLVSQQPHFCPDQSMATRHAVSKLKQAASTAKERGGLSVALSTNKR